MRFDAPVKRNVSAALKDGFLCDDRLRAENKNQEEGEEGEGGETGSEIGRGRETSRRGVNTRTSVLVLLRWRLHATVYPACKKMRPDLEL